VGHDQDRRAVVPFQQATHAVDEPALQLPKRLSAGRGSIGQVGPPPSDQIRITRDDVGPGEAFPFAVGGLAPGGITCDWYAASVQGDFGRTPGALERAGVGRVDWFARRAQRDPRRLLLARRAQTNVGLAHESIVRIPRGLSVPDKQ